MTRYRPSRRQTLAAMGAGGLGALSGCLDVVRNFVGGDGGPSWPMFGYDASDDGNVYLGEA